MEYHSHDQWSIIHVTNEIPFTRPMEYHSHDQWSIIHVTNEVPFTRPMEYHSHDQWSIIHVTNEVPFTRPMEYHSHDQWSIHYQWSIRILKWLALALRIKKPILQNKVVCFERFRLDKYIKYMCLFLYWHCLLVSLCSYEML